MQVGSDISESMTLICPTYPSIKDYASMRSRLLGDISKSSLVSVRLPTIVLMPEMDPTIGEIPTYCMDTDTRVCTNIVINTTTTTAPTTPTHNTNAVSHTTEMSISVDNACLTGVSNEPPCTGVLYVCLVGSPIHGAEWSMLPLKVSSSRISLTLRPVTLSGTNCVRPFSYYACDSIANTTNVNIFGHGGWFVFEFEYSLNITGGQEPPTDIQLEWVYWRPWLMTSCAGLQAEAAAQHVVVRLRVPL